MAIICSVVMIIIFTSNLRNFTSKKSTLVLPYLLTILKEVDVQ